MQKMDPQLQFIEPMECLNVLHLLEGDNWQYEVKFDGYRTIAIKQRNEVRIFSRNGNMLTQFLNLSIYKAVGELPGKTFIIDGEIVALDELRPDKKFGECGKRKAQ
jgi:bifunctional non-homologous end joining protein LigD